MSYIGNTEKIIITVQHTEAEHHLNNLMGGSTDTLLTAKGEEQARMLGKAFLAENGIERFRMYVSTMARTKRTAECMNEVLNLSPTYDERLVEVKLGEGTGSTREWFYEHCAPKKEGYDPDYRPFPNAESDRDIWNRVYPFYKEIIESPENNILIVAHGTSLSFLQSMIMRRKFEDVEYMLPRGSAGSVSRFEINAAGRVTVKYLNRLYF